MSAALQTCAPSSPSPVLRVEFGSVEDARRAVFSVLMETGLTERERSRTAGAVVSRLRSAGLLGQVIEQHYSAAQVAGLLGRCAEYVVKLAKAGQFGPVARDEGGWIIPASGVQSWLSSRTVSTSRKEIAA